MDNNTSAILLSLLVAIVGGINAWQNVNIKLAISNLRNEILERVSAQGTRIAVVEAAATAEEKWRAGIEEKWRAPKRGY